MNARRTRTFDVEHCQEKENRQQNGQPNEEEKDEQNFHEQMHLIGSNGDEQRSLFSSARLSPEDETRV